MWAESKWEKQEGELNHEWAKQRERERKELELKKMRKGIEDHEWVCSWTGYHHKPKKKEIKL
jgi:hypothetical protein